MANNPFVHLHLHTDFSLLDGAIQIKPLAQRTVELGMNACAMTDHGNMFGAVSFYNTMKVQGIKPIIGCETYLSRGSRKDRSSARIPGQKANHHLILLAKDLEGYKNLVRLTSKAYTEGFYYKPRIDRELLAEHSKGLIGLSACLSGVPSALLIQDKFQEAANAALEFEEILGKGNYYLEIQEHGLPAQERIRRSLVDLASRTGVPLVATNDAHYLTPEDARAHDVLLCIGSGKTVSDTNRLRYGTPNFYVRSPEEMWSIFGRELPEVLTRTVDIAEMCDLDLPQGKNHLPNYPIPASDSSLSIDDYFEKVVRAGFQKRKETVWDRAISIGTLQHAMTEYDQRLVHEIEMIKRMEFAGYFLIVWDFIKYAREHSIPVGPGRGSAAGSLVAYCLQITDLDPLKYNLLFERFLNSERVTMPDIDIDFCVRGRGEVINHVSNVYGRDSVCQIITFGTLASRAAIKDVGRALDIPYGEVERIAKLIPPPVRGRNVSIGQALEQVPELRTEVETNPQVRDLIDLAKRLEGCSRHASVHAAGVVISPVPLQELIPVAVSSKEELTTQYSMSDLEKTGMLKMDFLALTALTVISDCLASVKRRFNLDLDWTEISLDDAETMRLFSEGRTEAVFQFESSGMQEICRKLKPKGLEDLSALNALYRPGPLDGGMVEDFIERHHGQKTVKYIIPEMKEILNNTYGIIVYQEQIMQLAQKLAGYTLGEADLMRRAMGKKKRSEMAAHERKFVEGAVLRNINSEKAKRIFHLMEQFADYGFTRSHSVPYAYLAFQTAYLKTHFPEHFYAAVLSNELHDTAKVFKYSTEMRSMGIKLLPPDVNESDAGFTPLEGAIRYGLAAIKGIGPNSANSLIQTRENGLYKSFFDFTERSESGLVNKRVLESLVCAGAFDSMRPGGRGIHAWRASLHDRIELALATSMRTKRHKAQGQHDLFAAPDHNSGEEFTDSDVKVWSHNELLAAERNAIGFYITGHPLENYADVISEFNVIPLAELPSHQSGEKIAIAGIVTQLQVKVTRKGSQFALAKLEDWEGGAKCVFWPEVYQKSQDLLQPEAAVLVKGRLEGFEDGNISLVAEEVIHLDSALQGKARSILVRLPPQPEHESLLDNVFSILDQHRGECGVLLEMWLDGGVLVRAAPHGALKVRGSIELESCLRKFGCQVEWLNVTLTS